MPFWLYATTVIALLCGALVVYFRDVLRHPELRLTVWLSILSAAPVLIALLVIESGAFIVEQNTFGFLNGATLGFLGYTALFYAATRAGYAVARAAVANDEASSSKAIDRYFGWAVCLGALFLLYVNYVLSPKPFFDTSVDRFTYWGRSAFSGLAVILGNVSSFIPVGLGVLHETSKQKRYTLGAFLLYLIYLVLVGQKYGPVLNATVFFILPRLLVVDVRSIRAMIGRLAVPGIAVVLLGVGIAYANYSFFNPYKYAGLSVVEALLQRVFVLQGHVFWGSVNNSNIYEFSWSVNEFIDGMKTMMLMLSPLPSDVIEVAYREGRSFTGAYPAVLNVMFGIPMRILVHLVFGIMYGGFIRLVAVYIRGKKIAMSMIAVQVLMWCNYMLTMGKFEYIVDPKFWIFASVVVLGVLPGIQSRRLSASC